MFVRGSHIIVRNADSSIFSIYWPIQAVIRPCKCPVLALCHCATGTSIRCLFILHRRRSQFKHQLLKEIKTLGFKQLMDSSFLNYTAVIFEFRAVSDIPVDINADKQNISLAVKQSVRILLSPDLSQG